jgi:hypothetical protein
MTDTAAKHKAPQAASVTSGVGQFSNTFLQARQIQPPMLFAQLVLTYCLVLHLGQLTSTRPMPGLSYVCEAM